ncbi:fad binding domain-containing protein [Cystoisospora suis]|uniref:Fad binding domain-containing protein n=1 Tax=Cystoisospora suis TaxID=483139 RepID=A0A2C6KZB6_9APIC|nr:fad binding domain-containing protein [Cystoisospora suis]
MGACRASISARGALCRQHGRARHCLRRHGGPARPEVELPIATLAVQCTPRTYPGSTYVAPDVRNEFRHSALSRAPTHDSIWTSTATASTNLSPVPDTNNRYRSRNFVLFQGRRQFSFLHQGKGTVLATKAGASSRDPDAFLPPSPTVEKPLYVPVLIVGAGPIGLSLALLLRRMRLPCLLVERDEEAKCQPKAHYCSSRSMEVWRMLGHLDDVMENEVASLNDWRSFSYCTHLVRSRSDPSPTIAVRDHFKDAYVFPKKDGRLRYYECHSPCRVANLPQHILLPLLYARLFAGVSHDRERHATSSEKGKERTNEGRRDPRGIEVSRPPEPSLSLMHPITLELLEKTANFIHERDSDEQVPAALPLSQALFQTKWKTGYLVQKAKEADERGEGTIIFQGGTDPRPDSFVRSILVRRTESKREEETIVVDSAFVVACDGANSEVSAHLPDHRREGVDCLQRFVNITFVSHHLAALIRGNELLENQFLKASSFDPKSSSSSQAPNHADPTPSTPPSSSVSSSQSSSSAPASLPSSSTPSASVLSSSSTSSSPSFSSCLSTSPTTISSSWSSPPPSMLYYVMNADVIGVVVLHSLARGEFVAHIPFFHPHQTAQDDFPLSICEDLIHQLAGQRLHDLQVLEAKGWKMSAKVSHCFHGHFLSFPNSPYPSTSNLPSYKKPSLPQESDEQNPGDDSIQRSKIETYETQKEEQNTTGEVRHVDSSLSSPEGGEIRQERRNFIHRDKEPLSSVAAGGGGVAAPTNGDVDSSEDSMYKLFSPRVPRILIAGDAAHQLPPAGGLGMNLGMGDVLGLAWRLGQLYHRKALAFFPSLHQSPARAQEQTDKKSALLSTRTRKEGKKELETQNAEIQEQRGKNEEVEQKEKDDERSRLDDKRHVQGDDAGATLAWRLLHSYDQERRLVAKYTCSVAIDNFHRGLYAPAALGLDWHKGEFLSSALHSAAEFSTSLASTLFPSIDDPPSSEDSPARLPRKSQLRNNLETSFPSSKEKSLLSSSASSQKSPTEVFKTTNISPSLSVGDPTVEGSRVDTDNASVDLMASVKQLFGRAPTVMSKRALQFALAAGRKQMVVCRDWLPGIWSKRVENVKNILRNENQNLSLHYPGADLAYAYTSSELYRHPKRNGHEEMKEQNWRDTRASGPKVKVSRSPLRYLPTSWVGCRVPHAWLYGIKEAGSLTMKSNRSDSPAPSRLLDDWIHSTREPKVFRFSTVDLPFLHSPPCAYCFLVFSRDYAEVLATSLESLKRPSSYSNAVLPPLSFPVCWEEAEKLTSRSCVPSHAHGDITKAKALGSSSPSQVSIDRRPLTQSGHDLSRIGTVSAFLWKDFKPDRSQGECQDGRRLTERGDGEMKSSSDVRLLWSPKITRDKFLATLRRGDTSDSMKDCEEESLLIVLRPDGHILDIFDLRGRIHGKSDASLSISSSETTSNHQTEIQKLIFDILVHRLP